jgi:chromosome transmission fidelity protein 18
VTKEADAYYVNALNDLFAPLSKKRARDFGLAESEESRYVDRLSRALEGSGALDRIALGVSIVCISCCFLTVNRLL